MAIYDLFDDIADAIKEKDTSVTSITPADMPNAIRGISGGVELLTNAEWESLTTEQKRSYELVAIQTANTGYERGMLVYGAYYGYFNITSIKSIIIGGNNRGNATYTQLGDIRFSDGVNYLSSQYNNIESYSTKYGSFKDNYTRALFDNNQYTKCISDGGGVFEWSTTFTTAINLSSFTILELWTANDSAERDPYTNVYIKFIDSNNVEKTLTIGNTNLPADRVTLGYTNNNWQSELS